MVFCRVVSCCMKFDRDQTPGSNFLTEQILYDTTSLLFSAMLYDVVFVWPPNATLFYFVVCIFKEMLYSVVSNVAFVWPPLC